MNTVTNLTKSLINAICSSEEYLDYQNAKKLIDSDFDLKSKINSFKAQQINMQIRLSQGDYVSNEEKQNLRDLYTQLIVDDNVDTYLRCEKSIFKTVTSIYDEIVDSIDIDLDFMQ